MSHISDYSSLHPVASAVLVIVVSPRVGDCMGSVVALLVRQSDRLLVQVVQRPQVEKTFSLFDSLAQCCPYCVLYGMQGIPANRIHAMPCLSDWLGHDNFQASLEHAYTILSFPPRNRCIEQRFGMGTAATISISRRKNVRIIISTPTSGQSQRASTPRAESSATSDPAPSRPSASPTSSNSSRWPGAPSTSTSSSSRP